MNLRIAYAYQKCEEPFLVVHENARSSSARVAVLHGARCVHSTTDLTWQPSYLFHDLRARLVAFFLLPRPQRHFVTCSTTEAYIVAFFLLLLLLLLIVELRAPPTFALSTNHNTENIPLRSPWISHPSTWCLAHYYSFLFIYLFLLWTIPFARQCCPALSKVFFFFYVLYSLFHRVCGDPVQGRAFLSLFGWFCLFVCVTTLHLWWLTQITPVCTHPSLILGLLRLHVSARLQHSLSFDIPFDFRPRHTVSGSRVRWTTLSQLGIWRYYRRSETAY